MDHKIVFTGSAETEGQIKIFLTAAKSLESGVPRRVFTDSYLWKVMTVGRNGPEDSRAGSQAPDDTGGFFQERDGLVYLTDKAKGCITV